MLKYNYIAEITIILSSIATSAITKTVALTVIWLRYPIPKAFAAEDVCGSLSKQLVLKEEENNVFAAICSISEW